jgi:dTDP-L-rhamnose 4-epimerase
VCFEDGLQLRDYVNVRDVARANVLVMEDEQANFGVFNVGGKRPVTVQEFARIMIKEFGNGLEPLVPGEYRLGDTRHTISDVSRLEALGWQPTIPVEQNVREYVAWMREQQTTDEFLREADRVMREQGVVRTTRQR